MGPARDAAPPDVEVDGDDAALARGGRARDRPGARIRFAPRPSPTSPRGASGSSATAPSRDHRSVALRRARRRRRRRARAGGATWSCVGTAPDRSRWWRRRRAGARDGRRPRRSRRAATRRRRRQRPVPARRSTSCPAATPATAAPRSRCTRCRRGERRGHAAPAARPAPTSRTPDPVGHGSPGRGPGSPAPLEVDGDPGRRRPVGDGRGPRGAVRSSSEPRRGEAGRIRARTAAPPVPSPVPASGPERPLTHGPRRDGSRDEWACTRPEQFTDDEAATLRPYFTNLDRPVFALVNLPEVVKGALFARYSRSSQEPAPAVPRRVRRRPRPHRRPHRRRDRRPAARRGALRARVPRVRRRLRRAARRRAPRVRAGVEPAHEDPRVGPADGVPRAVDALHPVRHAPRRPLPLLPRPRRARRSRARVRATSPTWTRCSTRTPRCCPTLLDWARERYPKEPGDSDFVYKQTIKAKACDAVRGILPAATLSNVGIYGTGQAFEALLLRMRAHPLPEARTYAELMLDELRKVIPSFLTRVDRPDRGGAWSDYLAATAIGHRRPRRADLRRRRARAAPVGHAHRLRSRRRGQGARRDLLPAHAPARGPGARPGAAPARPTTASRCCTPTSGSATNRRHKPGRAFERTDYRFDVLADYGAFRDLQRHRMLTIEWQPLTPRHGYDVPEAVDEAGLRDRFDDAMERSASLYDALASRSRSRRRTRCRSRTACGS